ncbi:MAG: hypothetical protein OHK93_004871 [Ramalina farinacea]|uniref:SMP-30/Gluconolactonase/LRE-like region domain-containing protein n=1 Tax=Ramalina farinacea TaxID=258253 RepID=A0AA43QZF0_9LECA|nr:hypothetical protein [Ramalina farinacea]
MFHFILIFLWVFLAQVACDSCTGVSIPSINTYLLPEAFQGFQSVAGNLSTNFVNTVTSNASVNALFAAAKTSCYYAFDDEFYDILGSKTPNIQLVQMRSSFFAFEGGAWDYDKNQVWFISASYTYPTFISILDLRTNNVTTPDVPAFRNINPNGAYYFAGKMYFAIAGNQSEPNGAPAIYTIDTTTYEAEPIINSFFGEGFQSIDDLSWVKEGNISCIGTGPNLFFSTLDLRPSGIPGAAPLMLQDGVYRYSPQTQSVQGVISRADIVAPNGVRTDASGRYLYITGLAAPFNATGGDGNAFNSSVIYRFTLDEDCFPINKRLVAAVRSYADGLHVDDYGRIWTGEYEGITVRSPQGKVLGVFNAEALEIGSRLPPIANFAIAGDKLVVLALDRLYVIQLGQNVTSAGRGM